MHSIYCSCGTYGACAHPSSAHVTCAYKGISTEDIEQLDPDRMLNQYDDKFCKMTYTWDFFSPELYKKYISKTFDPASLIMRCGKWGLKVVPDGKSRPGVPQITEGVSTGRAACHLTNILLGRTHTRGCAHTCTANSLLCTQSV